MPKTKIVAIKGLSHEDWLKYRRQYIGGSDAAAILGLNPYSTQYTVWADKTGRLPAKEQTEAMKQGTELEGYVAYRFTEKTGKRVRRSPYMWGNTKYPWASANIDREVIGENALMEAKTTSVLNLRKFSDGEFPTQYYVQVVQYLAITECDRAYLAVLILNKGFMVYQLTRIENDEVPAWCESSVYVSDDEIAVLMDAEREFWHLVETDTPPDLSGGEADTNALNAVYAGGGEEMVDLTGIGSTLERYKALKERIKDFETELVACEQTIKAAMGNDERGQAGGWVVNWKTQKRRSFDAKAFAEDHANEDLTPYYRESSYRKFEVRNIG